MSKSDLLFLAVLGSLPLQLNKFFFPQYSFVLGIPVDYRAITIYFNDLVIIAYILFFLLENARKLPRLFQSQKEATLAVLALGFYLAVGTLFFSNAKAVPFWFLLKFWQLAILGIFASVTLSTKKIEKPVLLILGIAVFWQSFLIIGQFVAQRSLGFWFLGERTFDTGTVAIAHAQILGQQFLRPYGTFPHPNVAAAFLVSSFIVLLAVRHNLPGLIKKFNFSLAIPIVAILATYSQAAILALTMAVVVFAKSRKALLMGGVWLVVLAVFFIKFISDNQLASMAERLVLIQAALEITLKNPFFGIGSGNFIAELAKLNLPTISQIRLLQPVHNVFLLVLTENGLVGLLLFGVLLVAVARSANSRLKIALLAAILVFASFDHFLWTLQQGRLLFWLSISYILSQPKS